MKLLYKPLIYCIVFFYNLDFNHNFSCADAAMKKKLNLIRSSDLSIVVWCMEHALTSQHPRTRYSVGTDANYLWVPLSYMPTFVQDYVILKNKVKIPTTSAI